MLNVPLVDLKAQYKSIKAEIDYTVADVIKNTDFVKGPRLKSFEGNYANALGISAQNAIGCSNGTSAVAIALKATGVSHGDEVIVPSHTFFASIEPIYQLGAIPAFVDVKPQDYTMDPTKIEDAITEKTKAIMPVHLQGLMCDMTAIMKIAKRHKLAVIEDSAQAHLASLDNKCAGTFGDAAGFSFYPGKNLGAYGDAGLVVVADAEQANSMRKYIDHGRLSKYEHDMVGDNLRMDALQAAVLDVKLKHLPNWNASRRLIAKTYDAEIVPRGIKVLEPIKGSNPVYHLYVVEVSNRQEVQNALKENGISSGVHYPIPCHLQPAMKNQSFLENQVPITNRIVDRILSLPIYPEMTESQIGHVLTEFNRVAKP